MVENRVSKHQLYQEFAQNRHNSAVRRLVPFAASFAASSPLGVIAGLNLPAANEFTAQYPEVIITLTAALGLSSIGAMAQALDITRSDSRNGKIAQQIAQIEGRDPQTRSEKKQEIKRVIRLMEIASRISPTGSHLFETDIEHIWRKIRYRNRLEEVQNQAESDMSIGKWNIKAVEEAYPQDPQSVTDALIVAEKQWNRLIESAKQPEHRKRYGELMRQSIRRKLAEYLGGPDEIWRRRTKYENMSTVELTQEMKKLVGAFPVNRNPNYIFTSDSDYQNRSDSAEKKILFIRIRSLLAHAPTTRSYHEVLLRELNFLYNRGLKSGESGLPAMDESLLAAIGLGSNSPFADENMLFDPSQTQKAERKLYGLFREDRKAKWNPIYYCALEIKNPVKRLMLNAAEIAQESFESGLEMIIPRSLLERSWKSQYKEKYGERLKPLN